MMRAQKHSAQSPPPPPPQQPKPAPAWANGRADGQASERAARGKGGGAEAAPHGGRAGARALSLLTGWEAGGLSPSPASPPLPSPHQSDSGLAGAAASRLPEGAKKHGGRPNPSEGSVEDEAARPALGLRPRRPPDALRRAAAQEGPTQAEVAGRLLVRQPQVFSACFRPQTLWQGAPQVVWQRSPCHLSRTSCQSLPWMELEFCYYEKVNFLLARIGYQPNLVVQPAEFAGIYLREKNSQRSPLVIFQNIRGGKRLGKLQKGHINTHFRGV